MRLERVGGVVYVIARMQSFNSRGMPVCDVVVWRSTDDALRQLTAAS